MELHNLINLPNVFKSRNHKFKNKATLFIQVFQDPGSHASSKKKIGVGVVGGVN